MKDTLKGILTSHSHVSNISIKDLKTFLSNDFDVTNSDNELLKHKAKKILKLLKSVKRQKKLIKEYNAAIKDAKSLLSKTICTIYDEITCDNDLMLNVDTCYSVHILSRLIHENVYYDSIKNNTMLHNFSSKEDAERYVDFLSKIKPGTRFKCIRPGHWNDGVYNSDAKSFYGISDRERVYCFDNDKVWTIKAIGYFEDGLIIPFTEYECTDADGKPATDWQLPRYLYNNIEFIEDVK